MKRFLILLAVIGWTSLQLCGQHFSDEKMKLGNEYIAQHKHLAILEMQKFGIPASITLAQALHESDYGRSRLARLANNHFGAKSHNTWQGPSILHDDDRPQEKFRKYNDVAQSYQDHSMVLMKSRYDFLFRLDRYDYKNWAHGLKKAGYATDPNYGPKLIKIIEAFNLSQYDYPPQVVMVSKPKIVKKKKRKKVKYEPLESIVCNTVEGEPLPKVNLEKRKHIPFKKVKPMWVNSSKALVFPHNVTAKQVAKNYKVDLDDLVENNYLQQDEIVKAGTPIYLEPLRKKLGSFNNDFHTTKRGETLKDIAILYGVQLKRLEKFNVIEANKPMVANQQVGIRKKNKDDLQTIEAIPVFANIQTKKANALTLPAPNFEITETREVKPLPGHLFKPFYHDEVVEVEQKPTPQLIREEKDFLASSDNVIIQATEPLIPQPHYHKVEPGQTLYRLSVIYDTDVDTIRTLNQLNDDVIQIGRVVRVR